VKINLMKEEKLKILWWKKKKRNCSRSFSCSFF